MSMIKKAQRYMRKADRLSNEFSGYLQENPLVAVGLTLAIGTMVKAMSGGGEVEEVAKPARRRSAA